MYGVGPTGSGAQALLPHDLGAAGNPLLSNERINAAMDNNVIVVAPVSSTYRIAGNIGGN